MTHMAPTAHIGDLFTPRTREGIDRTVEAAGPTWQDQAYAIAVRLLSDRQWIVAHHIWAKAPPTGNPRAMAGVMMRLAQDGLARCTRITHRYAGAERSEQVWATIGLSEHTVLDMVAASEAA